ncbi:MAG: peptidoglycan-binding protein [Clostridia bacterium]|nr:peptidoglycan-binding protein [Clostridia bacterium]
MPQTPIIPETVTVHLGAPDAPASNVTLPFADYIKNVASSEIFPTWPDAALRANIYAQLTYTLNRIYTEYYRSRGYDFDITNDIGSDQSFVYGRDIFENISAIVDEIFNSYVRRVGSVEPLYAAYCDGVEVTCAGLSQWGTVELAEQGFTPLEILKNYYGDDIEIVENAPVAGFEGSAPDVPLALGISGPLVQRVQRRLNRISLNYPAIPKIYPADGVFESETEEAVKKFQEVFNLTPDGIVGNATWYRIQAIYNSVKRLSDLNSEGLSYGEIATQYPTQLQEGDTGVGVQVIQYFLAYVANFVGTVSTTAIDGSFGPATAASVRSFQRTYGLPETEVMDLTSYNTLYNVYLGLVEAQDLSYREGEGAPFPGTILREGAQGEDVTLLQSYLNFIGRTYTQIGGLPTTGYFGTQTAAAVTAFQELFDLPGARGTVNAATWNAIVSVYEDLYMGNMASEGQFPGYTVGE